MSTPRLARPAAKVRVRLVVWLSSMLSVLLLAGSVSDYRTTMRSVLQAYDQSLSDAAIGLQNYLRSDDVPPSFVLPRRAQRLLQTDSMDTVLYRVTDPQGRTLAGDESIPTAWSSAGPVYYDASVRGEALRVFSQPVASATGVFQIIVAETTRKRRDARRQVLITRAVTDSLVLVVTLGLVWLIVGVAMRPVERLAQEVQSRSGDDLSPLPLQGVVGEAQPLVHALNRLFGLIRETQKSQRRFIENAAHQLRTPLAALKGQSELALAQARGHLPADDPLVQRLHRGQQAADQLAHLTNQLLTLARSDRPTHDSAQRRVVSLPELVEHSVSAMLDQALARSQDLGAETEAATLEAVDWELRELLTNLIDNAIRYAPPGSRITVRCGTSDGQAYLEVEDNGPGIVPALREQVFERFYRLPGSAPGGSGLGLAIVQEIVGLYRGKVEILDPGQGPGVRVRASFAQHALPLQAAQPATGRA